MKRLLAALFAAVLSLGLTACEAPGASDEPAGVDGEADLPVGEEAQEEDAGDTQLDTGGGPAAVGDDDDDEHENHDDDSDDSDGGDD